VANPCSRRGMWCRSAVGPPAFRLDPGGALSPAGDSRVRTGHSFGYFASWPGQLSSLTEACRRKILAHPGRRDLGIDKETGLIGRHEDLGKLNR